MNDTEQDRERKKIYHMGAYDMCRKLLTSVRFGRAQRELLEEQAYQEKFILEGLGVTFNDG